MEFDSRDVDRGAAALDRLDKQSNITERATTKLSNAMKVGITAAMAASVAVMYKVIDAHRAFGLSISQLSSITGATGKDLAFYREQALLLGSSTTFAASEVATAFKLVASAKPDLLDSKDALAAVTRETLTLAEAASMDLPTAAEALGSALNQFSAGADQANRFINVLAAGSKFGAAGISEVSQALKMSGAVAAGVGVSFEEATAAIEALAAVGVKGAEAGTGFRAVLLKLSTQSRDEFNPEIVGLAKALQNLEAANLTTAQATKLFGLESITAGTALVKGAAQVEELTKKLTGTTTALDQARTNTNNLDGDIKAMGSAWEGVTLILGEALDPALRLATQTLTTIGTWAQKVALHFGNLANAIGAMPGAVSAFVTADLEGLQAILAEREKYAAEMERRIELIDQGRDATEQAAAAEVEAAKTVATIEAENIKRVEEAKAKAAALREQEAQDIAEKEAKKQAKLDEFALREAERQRASFDALKDQYRSEEEMLDISLQRRTEMLDGFLSNKIISLQEHNELLKEMEDERFLQIIEKEQKQADLKKERDEEAFFEAIEEQQIRDDYKAEQAKIAQDKENAQIEQGLGIRRGSVQKMYDFTDQLRQGDLQSAMQTGNQMIGSMNAQNEKQFRLQKSMALASAIVTLPSAVMKSYDNGGGWPWGLIPAALMLATGLNEINTIRSTTYSGGRQDGGYVSPGSMYQVNEAGPELLTTAGKTYLMTGGQSGSVTPVDRSSGGGKQERGGDVFNVDLRGASVDAVQRLEMFVRSINATFEDRAVAAMQDAQERGYA
jgi:TP901 family phage tail tape measure protein